MNLQTLEQGSPAWLKARLGNVTASRVKDVLAVSKRDGKPLKARQDYLMELVQERLTGFAQEHYVTPAMDWGTQNERYARAAFEVVSGHTATKVGIVPHPSIERFLCSPDAFADDCGLWEGKCPTTNKHVEWMLAGVIPDEHEYQMLAQLSCNPERQWNAFMSFDARMPPKLQVFLPPYMYRKDVEDKIAAMEKGIIDCLAEVAETTDALNNRPMQIFQPEEA